MNSFNHYAYGSCSEWMFYSMLGIDSAKAAYKEIKMKPEFGEGITWVKGHYDSIRGRIASVWEIQGNAFRWTVEVPFNTTATLYIPAKSMESIQENGLSLDRAKGVRFVKMEANRAIVEIGSGIYDFSVSEMK